VRSNSRRLTRLATTAAALLTATAAVALAASPADAAGPNYVALGDSYSSGVGTTSSYLNSCDQSTSAYPYLYAQAAGASSFSFEACTGATTSDVINSQLGTLSSSTTLVSITIGGNDVGFSTIMEDCILEGDSGCTSAVNGAENAVNTTLGASLDTTYSDIRAKAPNAKVVVLGYPMFYDLSQSSGCIGLDGTKRSKIDEGDALLNSRIKTEVAKYSNFVFEDVTPYFSGHELCDSTEWLHSLTWPISSSYHPTAAGHSGGYLPAMEAGA